MLSRSMSPIAPNHRVQQDTGISIRDLTAALRQILHEPICSVRQREQSALQTILEKSDNRCVLFGAGSFGRRALAELKRIDVQPLAISDNNPKLWGSSIEGTPLLSPQDAAEQFGADSVFFITIRNEVHWYRETFERLRAVGCGRIESASSIGWRFPDTFLPFLLYDLPRKLYQQADQVLRAGQIWEDDASRAEYLANIRLRALGDPLTLPKPTAEESYDLAGIFTLEPRDGILDCGAFDGDTVRSVIETQRNFASIDAIEADSNSFAKLTAYVDGLKPAQRRKIRLHHCAVGAERGTVRFENDGTITSKISDAGAVAVELLPIDEICASTPLKMIKMDIEGGEFDALLGAQRVIQRDRPILAICVYHCQQDIWRLPLLIRKMVPEYRMYLKTYSGDGIQTVAFAVPPERVLTQRGS